MTSGIQVATKVCLAYGLILGQPAMFVSYVVGPTAYLFLDRLKPDLLAHTMDNISVS
jgi:hypothetical protein